MSIPIGIIKKKHGIMIRYARQFSQRIALFDQTQLSNLVRTHQSERYAKGNHSLDHYITMPFFRLAHAKSLREVCGGEPVAWERSSTWGRRVPVRNPSSHMPMPISLSRCSESYSSRPVQWLVRAQPKGRGYFDSPTHCVPWIARPYIIASGVSHEPVPTYQRASEPSSPPGS